MFLHSCYFGVGWKGSQTDPVGDLSADELWALAVVTNMMGGHESEQRERILRDVVDAVVRRLPPGNSARSNSNKLSIYEISSDRLIFFYGLV